MRYAFGRCRLDTASRELMRDGEAVHLSPKAFELLRLLIEARPSVLTKTQLMTNLWPDAFVVEANLPVLVGEVRSALGDVAAAASSIRTHHGVGYSFVSDVRETRSSGGLVPADGPLALLRVGNRTIVLGTGVNSVGRDPECDVYLNDASVSRHHARIAVEGSAATVEDLGSKNGTMLRGDRVSTRTVLRDGDEMVFGSVRAQYSSSIPATTRPPSRCKAALRPVSGGSGDFLGSAAGAGRAAIPTVQLDMLLALREGEIRARLAMASNSTPVRPLATPPQEAAVETAPLEFPSWPLSLLAVPILVRFAIFVVALVTEPWAANPNHIIPVWAQLLQASAFAGLALMLLRFGRHDRRAWALGLFILDAGTTLLTPFVRASTAPTVVTWLGLHLRTDAFQAAMAWFFASLFPRSSTRPRLAATFFVGTTAAFALGVLLVVVDATAKGLGPAAPSVVIALQRGAPSQGDWYFTLQFLFMAPLLVLVPLKLRECGPDARRRFYWLALGLTVGFLPLVANVILQTYWARFGDAVPPYQRLRGALIVTALTAVPVAAAYAALVQRTLDLRLVLRQALQYVLARAVIRGVAFAPFVGTGRAGPAQP